MILRIILAAGALALVAVSGSELACLAAAEPVARVTAHRPWPAEAGLEADDRAPAMRAGAALTW